MKGQLHEHPLVELIREISTARLTGALRLARERARMVLYFEAGAVIYAVSNLKPFRLTECLRRWGMIAESQATSSAMSDDETAAALLASGAVTEEVLAELRARQVEDMLRPALLWTEGLWEFDARVRLTEAARVLVDAGTLLVEAARRLSPAFVTSRFTNPDETLFPIPDAPTNLMLNPEEGFVMSRVTEPLTVRELLSLSGLASTQTFVALYALVNSGTIRRGSEPRAFSDEELRDALALKDVTARMPAPQQATAHAAPAQKSSQQPGEEFDEERELQNLFARLSNADSYYEVLGVRRSASSGEIKRAYYSLAKRFHPDKFRQHADTQLHARVESAFADIAQAYDTLKDEQQRAAYDQSLKTKARQGGRVGPAQRADAPWNKAAASDEKAQQSESATAQEAEKSFRRGRAALEQGALKLAVGLLSEAARLAPNNADYRAYFGRALACDPKTRRQAETEFQAAIAANGSNPLYHIFLAELYRDIGLHRRAQTELERALSLEPNNAEARRLLDSLLVKK